MAKALVIGAQGVLGAAMAHELRQDGWEVLRAGRREEDAPDFRLVDLDRPRSLSGPLAEVDLAVNCVLHPDLVPQRLALSESAAMLDIASVPRDRLDPLKAEAETADGLLVNDAGLNPGLTTLVLRDLLATHPETDGVELVNTLSVRQSSGRNAIGFFTPFLTASAHRPTAVFPLPPPFGSRRCLQLSEGEEGWLAGLSEDPGGKVYVCFKEGVVNRGLLAANALRLLSMVRPVRLPAGRTGPEGLTREPKADWVAVTRGGSRLAAFTIEGRGDYLLTARAAAVFANALNQQLASGAQIRGLHPADQLFQLADLRAEFEKRHVRIQEQPV